MAQIGLRGSGYAAVEFDWPRAQGFRVVQAEECRRRSVAPLKEKVRAQVSAGPVYLTVDIDGLNPSVGPGIGTPRLGVTGAQGLEIIRGYCGLGIVERRVGLATIREGTILSGISFYTNTNQWSGTTMRASWPSL